MEKHVLILGAGFGGLELAARLSESLADQVRVTLIDQNETFSFGYSKLDVPFGRKTTADVSLQYAEIAQDGVEFRQERVTAIEPETRRVTTDRRSYDADILVVALGAGYDYAATPGFSEGGYEYYSLGGAERMRDALPEFEGGTIRDRSPRSPVQVPARPLRRRTAAARLPPAARDQGRRRDPRGRADGGHASDHEGDVAEPRRARRTPDRVRAESAHHRARHAAQGGAARERWKHSLRPLRRHSCPPRPDVVEASGLAVDGWIPVERANVATRFPDVYAVGDVANAGTAKAGVFAEAAAAVVAADIAARLRGEPPPPPWDGAGNCYIEFGGGAVGKVEANFLGGPAPTARLVGPSPELAADKAAFGATRRERWFGAAG